MTLFGIPRRLPGTFEVVQGCKHPLSASRRPNLLLPLCILLFGLIIATGPAGFAQELSEGDLIPQKNATTAASPAPITVQSPAAVSAPAGAGAGTAPSDEAGGVSLAIIILGLLITGMLLLFVEVALIPGFGITGVSGILVILGGLGLAFWKLDPRVAALYALGSLGALIALVFWAIYVFPHTAMGKRFVLNTRITIEDGFTAVQDLSRFVGMEGVATSDLRPSGIANLGGERIDVVSEGDFIPRGTKIRALKLKQTNLVVIPIEPPKA